MKIFTFILITTLFMDENEPNLVVVFILGIGFAGAGWCYDLYICADCLTIISCYSQFRCNEMLVAVTIQYRHGVSSQGQMGGVLHCSPAYKVTHECRSGVALPRCSS